MPVITEVRRVCNAIEKLNTNKGSKKARFKTTDMFVKCDNGKVYRVKPEYWNSIQKYQTLKQEYIQH
jgi:predicted SnoaL-like aldol condensation-catalyzing enzyme